MRIIKTTENGIIDLNEKMIPYKEYIRKIVYAHTVNYHNSYDTRFRAVEIFRKLPVKHKQNKIRWTLFLWYLFGIGTGIYLIFI